MANDPLQVLCAAAGGMLQPLQDLISDTPDGPPWSALADPDRIPVDGLSWLGQFVGVRVTQGAAPGTRRREIREAAGWRRGTPAAMRAAVAATLTGARTVTLREQYGSPYRVRVEVFAGECPDPATSEAAARSQKPAGIVLEFAAVAGQNWDSLDGDDWDDLDGDQWDDLAST